jgi:hypothetical protein
VSYPLVLIEWEDSARPDSQWRYLSECTAKEIVRCQSVGFLIYDGKDVKTLAPNLGDANGPDTQACGIIRIPARCVMRVRKLRVGR